VRLEVAFPAQGLEAGGKFEPTLSEEFCEFAFAQQDLVRSSSQAPHHGYTSAILQAAQQGFGQRSQAGGSDVAAGRQQREPTRYAPAGLGKDLQHDLDEQFSQASAQPSVPLGAFHQIVPTCDHVEIGMDNEA